MASCIRSLGAATAAALLILAAGRPALAAGPDDAKGLWMTAEKDAVIEFKPCADAPSALCGNIVWDRDAGGPKDTCGLKVAQLDRYDGEAWRDGWVYDPRADKKYKGALRVKAGELHIRAFIGTEILGQTERLRHVDALPTEPACKR